MSGNCFNNMSALYVIKTPWQMCFSYRNYHIMLFRMSHASTLLITSVAIDKNLHVPGLHQSDSLQMGTR